MQLLQIRVVVSSNRQRMWRRARELEMDTKENILADICDRWSDIFGCSPEEVERALQVCMHRRRSAPSPRLLRPLPQRVGAACRHRSRA
jgi:hypothetical protein